MSSPDSMITPNRLKKPKKADVLQRKLVKATGQSVSPDKIRKHGMQGSTVSHLVNYSRSVEGGAKKAHKKKQEEDVSQIQAQLGTLVHAEEKDYFNIAKKLYILAATKEPDLNKKIGIRRAQKLEAVLSHEGVDDAIAEVIKETAAMQDPADILVAQLDGKMGDSFDLEELRIAWDKAKKVLPDYKKPDADQQDLSMEVEPRLIAQALALKRQDVDMYERLEDEEGEEAVFNKLIDDMIVEDAGGAEHESKEDDKDQDQSVYDVFWEDLTKLESEFTRYEREEEKERAMRSKERSKGAESKMSLRSKSPERRSKKKKEEVIEQHISREELPLLIKRERESFFAHLNKIRKAHQLQINHVKIIARDKAREVIYQRLDGVKKVFAQEMAGMISQYEIMSSSLAKKEAEIFRIKEVILKQEKMISEMNIFINSRFFQEMDDIKTAKMDLKRKQKEKEEAIAEGKISAQEFQKPLIMNEAFAFYNSYFNLQHQSREKLMERALVKKFKQEADLAKDTMLESKSETTMLHNVVQLMKETDKANQETIKELEEIGENQRKENKRTIEQYEHKIKKLLEDYMKEKEGIHDNFEKYKEMVEEELKVNNAIRTTQEDTIESLKKELKQVKTVLKYPRLHHKFLESLEFAQIEEYKDEIRVDIKDQMKLHKEMKKNGKLTPIKRGPAREGSPAPSETFSSTPALFHELQLKLTQEETSRMKNKKKGLMLNNSSKLSTVVPGSVISPSVQSISNSVQGADFSSTAPTSLANVPLAQAKWGTQVHSFSSSRNLSPFKAPKGKISEMMHLAAGAVAEISGRNTNFGGDSTSTFPSRRAISIQAVNKFHKKQLSSPGSTFDRAKFNSSTLLAPLDLSRSKQSTLQSPRQRPDVFQSTGTSFGFQGMFRQTQMSQMTKISGISNVPESIAGESEKY